MAATPQDADMPMEDAPIDQDGEEVDSSEEESETEAEAPAELMVTSRAKRSNAGNRMSTLLAKSAEEEEEWGEEWEEAANEEEFQGDDVNEQEDYNMDSSSSEEEYGADDDDEAGEKELRKAERQERNKKRKAATNPFAARVAAIARKKVKLDVPQDQSPSDAPPRPKKKSERASWIPTEEDGPVRTSLRKQTVANKEATLSKLKEKDRRRDDTLAMMKAAEARKEKDAPKPLTQAERLAEAARNERINKKTLHRWEEAEEARAAERQAKIDALKNRQMEGPFVRFYSGPAIWVDEKIKYTGKDAPSLEALEEKLNKEPTADAQPSPEQNAEKKVEEGQTEQATDQPAENPPAGEERSSEQPPQPQQPQDTQSSAPAPTSGPQTPSIPVSLPTTEHTPQPAQVSQVSQAPQPWTAVSQANGGDVFMGSHGMSYSTSVMFAPPTQDSFLYGIDQFAQSQNNPSDLPPNPFTQASPFNTTYNTTQPTMQQPHPALSHPLQNGHPLDAQALLSQFQNQPPQPTGPPPPPRKKIIKRALRNLLILSSFPNLDLPPSTRKSTTTLIKDKDRAALIQLSTTLFNWSVSDATAFVNTMLSNPSHTKLSKKAAAEREAALKPVKPLCAVTNAVARYRDPETGIAYRDARAFGVLRGVVGGGFVWSGDLGCYVGGRAKPLESMVGGKGFLGMPPAKGVPKRFLEIKKAMPPPPPPSSQPTQATQQAEGGQASAVPGTPVQGSAEGAKAPAAGEGNMQSPAPVKMEGVVPT